MTKFVILFALLLPIQLLADVGVQPRSVIYTTRCQYQTISGYTSDTECPVVSCKLSNDGKVGTQVIFPNYTTPCREDLNSQKGAYGCVLNGASIPDGTPILAFSSDDCATAKREQRHCINGTLTGSLTFTPVCPRDERCMYNGKNIPLGLSVPGFSKAEVEKGDSCANYQAQIMCYRGGLGDNAKRFPYDTCKEKN